MKIYSCRAQERQRFSIVYHVIRPSCRKSDLHPLFVTLNSFQGPYGSTDVDIEVWILKQVPPGCSPERTGQYDRERCMFWEKWM